LTIDIWPIASVFVGPLLIQGNDVSGFRLSTAGLCLCKQLAWLHASARQTFCSFSRRTNCLLVYMFIASWHGVVVTVSDGGGIFWFYFPQ